MAQGDTPITLVGNIVADPELRYTPSGSPVANFRVASTPRVFNRDANRYEDGDSVFLTCNAWNDQAENVMETLSKGVRAIVVGTLSQRNYETRNGEKRTVYEIRVDDCGPSLKFATAQVHRADRRGNGGGDQGGNGGGNWPSQGNRGGGPTAGYSNGNQGGGGFDAPEEPPF